MGIVAALGLYYGAQLLAKGITAITTGVHMAMAVAQMFQAAMTGTLTTATAGQIAAQYGLNSAMYACPVVWILMAIILIIAAIYGVVAAINKITGSTISATGVILGVLTTAIAFVWNIFATVINFIIDCFAILWNFIAAFVNFFANVFNDPIAAIANLFFDLVDCILALLQALASAIDTLFGSNLASSVQGWRDSLSGWVDETFGDDSTEIMATVSGEDYHLDRWAYSDAYSTGYSAGESVEDSVSSSLDTDSLLSSLSDYDTSSLSDYDTSTLLDDASTTADNTSSIADSMDITEEELKYLRDLAEQEVVNRYTTAEISVEMNNNNTVSSDVDLDGMVSTLEDKIYEMSLSMAEGVHS